ncbi:hypothetical protein [Kitasatospora aureofaciens]|uniref:hypothetical protein n=1 Tax=Kitasatospora aureofaciens TaxID=1894 RepID=UPI001C48D62F|nr:hypothetical protein [Kitasatospora aureofaciens]MBV6700647.1 hypothetical protein [Kitasatospora aureofaciens]
MRMRNVLPVALLIAAGLLAGANTASAAGYPGFQCFKTTDRVEYCSDAKVKNHAVGAAWIKTCPADVVAHISKPYVLASRPSGAHSC